MKRAFVLRWEAMREPIRCRTDRELKMRRRFSKGFWERAKDCEKFWNREKCRSEQNFSGIRRKE